MTVYVPNSGEKEMLKDFLNSQGIILGLYRNVVVPDGSLVASGLTELDTGGGRGYAPIALNKDIVENAQASGKWYVSQDANGKASAQYGLSSALQAWTFNAADVADGVSAYGIFAYTWVLPFHTGAKEIKVGDTIKGATSTATGIVTGVEVQSGTWAGGTAAGNLKIMTKTGIFQDGENIIVLGEVGTLNATPTAPGTGYAVGDIVEIAGGSGALAVVTGETGGAVDSVVLVTGGKGYTTGTGKATVKVTGSGNDDLTVNITALASTAYAVTNTGVTADASKQLLWTEAFSAGTAIETVGQQIQYLPIVTLSTA